MSKRSRREERNKETSHPTDIRVNLFLIAVGTIGLAYLVMEYFS